MKWVFLMAAMSIWTASCEKSGTDRAEDGTKRIVLKAADDHELSYPTTQGLVKMGDLLAEWTEGRITVEVYHSAQLGSEKETIEQTQFGAIDINRVNLNPLTQLEPELKLFALPYIFRDEAHMEKTLNGQIGEEMLGKLERRNLIGLGYYNSGQRSFYARKPLRSMADLKGLKIRVQKAQLMLAACEAVGASPTPMAFEEVYTSLQTGVIDGAENNFPSWITKGHYEVAKHYLMDEHSRVPEVILFSKLTWEKLSEEDRALIRKAARESVPYQWKLWSEKVEESLRKAEEAGCQIVRLEDKTEFVDAMRDVYAEHAADLTEWIERVQNVR
jgi:tripartite ATP-independent transporter DctP family solute receptor